MKRQLSTSEAEAFMTLAGEFHRKDVEQTKEWLEQLQGLDLSNVYWETRVHLELVATILRWRLG